VKDLRELLLDAPVMVVVHEGREGTIELFSHRAREVVGGRDFTGHRLSEAFPELAAHFRQVEESVRAGRPCVGINEPFTLDWRGQGRLETRYLSCFWQPVFGEHGTVERSVMFAFDVTASLVGPHGESGSLGWLHVTLDCIPTPVVLAEPGTARISFANTAARQLSQLDMPRGATFAKAVGLDVGYFCTDAAGTPIREEELPAARAARGEPVDGMELMWHTPRGALSLVCFAETVPATATLPSFIVLSFFDTTAVRALERELRDSSKSREDFMALAGHELRTPLTALKLRTQAMLATSPGSEGLAAIERAATRMEDLVEQMLEAERIRTFGIHPRPQELDLCETTDRVIQRVIPDAQPCRCPISRLGARELRGQWDGELLERALSNLVRNALRFGRGRPVRVTCNDLGERVSISVADEGIGIDPEDQDRIFDRFARAASRRNFGGLGLGLWITRTIVSAMGGTVGVQSAVGKGATFTMELPKRLPGHCG
jgi:signal transduction histidine kinase